MTLWADTAGAEGWWDRLAQLPEEQLRRVCFTVLSATPGFIRPSFRELYSEEYSNFLRDILDEDFLHTLASEDQLDEVIEHIMDLDEVESNHVPGAASLTMGIVHFFEQMPPHNFTGDNSYEVLGQCYEAVLHAERLPIEVFRMSIDNDHCRDFIDFQRDILSRFSGDASVSDDM